MTALEILQHIAELKQRLARVTDPMEREDLLDDLVYFQQLLREEQKKDRAKARAMKHLALYYHRRPKSEKGIRSVGSVPAVDRHSHYTSG